MDNFERREFITIDLENLVTLEDGRQIYLIPGPRGYPGVDGARGKKGKNGKPLTIIQYLLKLSLIDNEIACSQGLLYQTQTLKHRLKIEDLGSDLFINLSIGINIKNITILAESGDEMISFSNSNLNTIKVTELKKLLKDDQPLRVYATFVG